MERASHDVLTRELNQAREIQLAWLPDQAADQRDEEQQVDRGEPRRAEHVEHAQPVEHRSQRRFHGGALRKASGAGGRKQHDQLGVHRLQALHHGGNPGLRIGFSPLGAGRTNADIQLCFGNVNANKRGGR